MTNPFPTLEQTMEWRRITTGARIEDGHRIRLLLDAVDAARFVLENVQQRYYEENVVNCFFCSNDGIDWDTEPVTHNPGCPALLAHNLLEGAG